MILTIAQYELQYSGPRSKRATWEPDWLHSAPVESQQTEEPSAVTADSTATFADCADVSPIDSRADDGDEITPSTPAEFVAYSDWCWSQVWAGDYRYLTAPRITPEPCPWCGGRLVHNPLCEELRRSLERVMPFGKYKGRPLSEIRPDYLEWLVNASGIDTELRDAIQLHLQRTQKEKRIAHTAGPSG